MRTHFGVFITVFLLTITFAASAHHKNVTEKDVHVGASNSSRRHHHSKTSKDSPLSLPFIETKAGKSSSHPRMSDELNHSMSFSDMSHHYNGKTGKMYKDGGKAGKASGHQLHGKAFGYQLHGKASGHQPNDKAGKVSNSLSMHMNEMSTTYASEIVTVVPTKPAETITTPSSTDVPLLDATPVNVLTTVTGGQTTETPLSFVTSDIPLTSVSSGMILNEKVLEEEVAVLKAGGHGGAEHVTHSKKEEPGEISTHKASGQYSRPVEMLKSDSSLASSSSALVGLFWTVASFCAMLL